MSLIPSLSDKKVLYLEDEVLIALDGEQQLENMGFGEVVMVNSLSQAENALKTNEFDLAVLDINLGNGQNSLGLARDLENKGVKLAFTSGYNASEGVVDDFDAQFVSKPFTEQSIKRAIATLFS